MKSRLQATVQQYRQQLLAHEHDAEVALEHAYQHTLAAIQPRLDALYREIAAYLDAGEAVPPSFLYERLRLESLTLLVKQHIDHNAAVALLTTRQLQHFGVSAGQQSALAMLNASVPTSAGVGVKWTFGLPSQQAMVDLIGATQAGSPLADLFDGFGSEAAKNVGNVLISGLSVGDNPRKVAGDVAQALQVPRWRATTIARTEMLRSYRSANLETYRANNDVVSQWRWTADKSSRTCIACLAMDGTLHDLDEDFGSHVNCRCAPIPVTKSWDEILGPLGIDTSDIPETSVSARDMQTGAEWFDQQDEETQKAILGPSAFDLWNERDDMDISDFVGRSSDADWGHSIYVKSVNQLKKG